MAQCGIVDTAAVEALNGDVTAQVLVDMLVERGLLQYSEEGECFVTGEVGKQLIKDMVPSNAIAGFKK